MTLDSKTRVWKKVACFYALTLIFSFTFGGFILRAGKLEAGNLLFVTGAMWSPALATFATKKIFRERIRDLPWQWTKGRYIALAYFLPVGYSLPIYLFVWFTGLGPFNSSTLPKILTDFGWQNLPTCFGVSLFVLFTATLGMVSKLSRALGEEIGWRGFLVPELAKVVGFRGVGVISGLMWAAFHYPVLLFADYNAGAPAWYSLVCFTVSVVAGSFIMTWLTLRTRSLWPAAILHASHNLFIQSILTPLTKDVGPTKYITDEFGIGLVVTISIAAALVWIMFGRETPSTLATSGPESARNRDLTKT
jgi:membrane protease YdiL (CAAX protease family)